MNLNEISIKLEPEDIVEDHQPQPTFNQDHIKVEVEEETGSHHNDSPMFQCPKCPRVMTSLNRLRLHICSDHEHSHHNLQCPICNKKMLGCVYQTHVLKEHSPLLDLKDEIFLFAPKVWSVLTRNVDEEKVSNSSQPHSIEFNEKNPWKEILSSTSRKKRSVDAVKVASIRRKTETESYQGETDTKAFWKPQKKQFRDLQNKVNFICDLEQDSHYKNYLIHLKHLKLKKMLLFKFTSRMSDMQIQKIKREIARSEAILNKFSSHDSNKLKAIEMALDLQKKKYQDDLKKKQTIIKENQILKRLKKKYQDEQLQPQKSKNQDMILEERKNMIKKKYQDEQLQQQKRNHQDMIMEERKNMIKKKYQDEQSKRQENLMTSQSIRGNFSLVSGAVLRETGKVDLKAKTVPFIDLKGLTASAGDSMKPHGSVNHDSRDSKIKCETLNSEDLIALNIPVEEIIGNNYVIKDVKIEINK